MSVLDRFFDKVSPEPNSGCWLWMASGVPAGYGVFTVDGVQGYAHRFSYETANKTKIPNGMEIDHLCRVRCCVNPDHMEVVTHAENIARRHHIKGEDHYNRKKMVCRRGHALTPENTYSWNVKGGKERVCKICHREKVRLLRSKK